MNNHDTDPDLSPPEFTASLSLDGSQYHGGIDGHPTIELPSFIYIHLGCMVEELCDSEYPSEILGSLRTPSLQNLSLCEVFGYILVDATVFMPPDGFVLKVLPLEGIMHMVCVCMGDVAAKVLYIHTLRLVPTGGGDIVDDILPFILNHDFSHLAFGTPPPPPV